ncbi:MAG TPA: exodeoxyribonuclease VII small subunit [Ktedonobacteraceae bacterium]|jgi:exodeoxyribonuclease VII small subunit|nr:MAG: exodeoxyribonuclease VII small subunit [Ktedonobacter sp. 13_2_20CM_2_56_8]OLE09118.1 MAG: exodeoxyribonuclease VII small subunit [Ktedonobacter sp. 13_1_20CM_4_53_11]
MMESLTFEEAYAQLEAAVTALQDGQMPLERALQYYEEGMKLAQYCNELLQKAELRVQQLSVDNQGAIISQPLELP